MSGPLNDTPSEIVRKLLVDLGVVTIPENQQQWPCYVDHLPDKPDKAACVFDTAGIIRGRTHFDGEMQEHHGIEVMVRADTRKEAYIKAKHIARAFDTDVLNSTVELLEDEYTVHALTRSSDVVRMGIDPVSRRRLYSVNAIASIRMETAESFGTGSI